MWLIYPKTLHCMMLVASVQVKSKRVSEIVGVSVSVLRFAYSGGPHLVRSLVVLVALAGMLFAAAQPASAAAERCTYSFRNNETVDIKLKVVVDGAEVTRELLAPGDVGSLDVTSDDTVVVRRPNDRERLFRASGCEGSAATIDIGEQVGLPEGVAGSQPVSVLPTSCWAVDRQLEDGTTISDVTIINAGDPRVIYARSDDKFLGSIPTRGADYDNRIALVRVRGGERKGDYPCERGWTGDVSITQPNEAEGIGRVNVEVLAAAASEFDGTNVLWRYGVSGPAVGQGGSFSYLYYLTNTATGEITRVGLSSEDSVEVTRADCARQNLALRLSYFGETYVALVDLDTGERTLVLDTFVDNAVDFSDDYGFDCKGNFWFMGPDGPDFIVVG